MRPLLEIQEAILAEGGVIAESAEDGFRAHVRIGLGGTLMLICAAGKGWDHVSVSAWRGADHAGRCPRWDEMDRIKRLCFLPTECAMQLHPPTDQHVTGTERRVFTDGKRRMAVDPTPVSKYVLHLWRPQGAEIPTPPIWMV